jgi:hypothetical protein
VTHQDRAKTRSIGSPKYKESKAKEEEEVAEEVER